MAPEQHNCSKERELGIMGERIEHIAQSQTRVESKLDTFIDSADKKYATKDELHGAVKQINKDNSRQDDDIKWTKQKILDIVYKLAMLSGIIFVLVKAYV
jgi:hypothetical protein